MSISTVPASSVIRPDGSSTATAYGASGGKAIATVTGSVKKADGSSDGIRVKRNEFNILGQLTRSTDAYGSSSAVSTAYTYDGNGNLLTAIVDGDAAGTTTTTYEYDAAGNRRKIIDPDIDTVTLHHTATRGTFEGHLGLLGTPLSGPKNLVETIYHEYMHYSEVKDHGSDPGSLRYKMWGRKEENALGGWIDDL